MKLINAGLIHRVTLRHFTPDPQSVEYAHWTFKDHESLRAKVGRVTGNEQISLGKLPTYTSCEVVLDYSGPINEGNEVIGPDGQTVHLCGDTLFFGQRKLCVTKIAAVNEESGEVTLACREHHA